MRIHEINYRNPSLYENDKWTDTYWPMHTPLKRETLTLSSNSSKVLEGHGVRKCAFWKRFLPQLGNGKFDGRYGDFFYHNSPNINPHAVDEPLGMRIIDFVSLPCRSIATNTLNAQYHAIIVSICFSLHLFSINTMIKMDQQSEGNNNSLCS